VINGCQSRVGGRCSKCNQHPGAQVIPGCRNDHIGCVFPVNGDREWNARPYTAAYIRGDGIGDNAGRTDMIDQHLVDH